MIMPLQTAMRQRCEKCGWKNPAIRPKGDDCVLPPTHQIKCPNCGGDLKYVPISFLKN